MTSLCVLGTGFYPAVHDRGVHDKVAEPTSRRNGGEWLWVLHVDRCRVQVQLAGLASRLSCSASWGRLKGKIEDDLSTLLLVPRDECAQLHGLRTLALAGMRTRFRSVQPDARVARLVPRVLGA